MCRRKWRLCKSIVKRMSHRRRCTIASISFVNSAEINKNTNSGEEEGDIADIEPGDRKGEEKTHGISIYARGSYSSIIHKESRPLRWFMDYGAGARELDTLRKKDECREARRLFIVLVNETDRSGRSKCWPCEFTTYRSDIINDHSHESSRDKWIILWHWKNDYHKNQNQSVIFQLTK